MSLHVIERLRESGKCAEIRLYDSVVARRELEELADDLTVYDDFYEGCSNADLVIIANNHPVFSKMEFNKVVNKMNDGGFVRSEERRVGKSVSVRVDLGGRRIIKKKRSNVEAKS